MMKMRWIFQKKFSKRIGNDYEYKCDKCGYKTKVEDIDKLPHRSLKKVRIYYCPKCKELEDWRR
jgi:predicted RNA-binding Zn-ribbon protein involved in translation (DUF1610 family)